MRNFHMIAMGISLLLLSLTMFLVLNYFFHFFAGQIAQAASERVANLGASEEVSLAIQISAAQISPKLSISIISVLALGMMIVYIVFDILNVNLIIKPIQQIGEKADEIIKNQNKLGDQIEPPFFIEMRKLTFTFNRMSRELETQMKELEDKVQKRTQELKQANEKIIYLANHDTLTGLPNRRLFNEHISHAIKLARRNKEKLSLLMVDLNHFKRINDSYGHILGDEILRKVASRFQNSLRESDLVSRWGGDEFTILAFNVEGKTDVKRIITRIFQAFKHPIEAKGKQFKIEISIGAALFPADGKDKETLLRHADAALYKAKETKSSNAYQFFQESFWPSDRLQEKV